MLICTINTEQVTSGANEILLSMDVSPNERLLSIDAGLNETLLSTDVDLNETLLSMDVGPNEALLSMDGYAKREEIYMYATQSTLRNACAVSLITA